MSLTLTANAINNYIFGNASSVRRFVKCATTGTNITLSTPPASLDGVTLVTGDRILVKDQTITSENGIYYFDGTILQRSEDANVGTNFASTNIIVNQGALNANTLYVCSSPTGTDVIGSNNLSFLQKGTISNIATGTGLTGGAITRTGTISMANMGAYTYKGNVTTATAVPTDVSLSLLRSSLTKIFYINNSTGSDSNSGTSSSEPFLTVNKAISRLLGTNGQIILAITGIDYTYTGTNIPNNITLRFSTSLSPVDSFSSWTTVLDSGGSVSGTPAIETFLNYGGAILSTAFTPVGLTATQTQIGGCVLQWTSGSYNTQYAQICFLNSANSKLVVKGDFSSLVGGETFIIYKPPVNLYNNYYYTSSPGTTLIFNNINYPIVFNLTGVKSAWVFDYSRFSNENNTTQYFNFNNGTFYFLNSGLSMSPSYFYFAGGECEAYFENSTVGYLSGIVSGSLGMAGTSHSILHVNNCLFAFVASTTYWALNATRASITNSTWFGYFYGTKRSNIYMGNNCFYTGTNYTPAGYRSNFYDCNMVLENNRISIVGTATNNLYLARCQVAMNNIYFHNLTGVLYIIQYDAGCQGTWEGTIIFNCTTGIPLSIVSGSKLVNNANIDSSTSTISFYNISIAAYGEFISNVSLSSFSNGASAFLNDFTGGFSITATTLASFVLPYRFVSVGRFSTNRYGVAQRAISSQSRLTGANTWTLPPYLSPITVTSLSNESLSLNGVVIDGVTLAVGDRVLLQGQTTGSENGIYDVTSGTATRSTDAQSGQSFAALYMSVNQGTSLANTIWMCSNVAGSDVVGTNTLTFDRINNTSLSYTATGISTYTHRGGTVYLTCWGGGGAGGLSVDSSVAGNTYIGAGGGGGAAIFRIPITNLIAGQSYSIVVGAGGFGRFSYTSGIYWGGSGYPSGIITSSTPISGTINALTIFGQDLTNINGSGTTFTSDFVENDLINISGYIFRIYSVTNDTTMIAYGTVGTDGFGTIQPFFAGDTAYKISGIFAFGGGSGIGTIFGTSLAVGIGGSNYAIGTQSITNVGKAGAPVPAAATDGQYGGVYYTSGASGGQSNGSAAAGSKGNDIYGKYFGGTGFYVSAFGGLGGGGGGAGFGGTGGTVSKVGAGFVFSGAVANSGAGGSGGVWVSGVPITATSTQAGGSGYVQIDLV
jgi:hypothetical protein